MDRLRRTNMVWLCGVLLATSAAGQKMVTEAGPRGIGPLRRTVRTFGERGASGSWTIFRAKDVEHARRCASKLLADWLLVNNTVIQAPGSMPRLDISKLVNRQGQNVIRWQPSGIHGPPSHHYTRPRTRQAPALELVWWQ